MKEHFWKFILIILLSVGLYEIYSHGWLSEMDYHKELFHVVLELFR